MKRLFLGLLVSVVLCLGCASAVLAGPVGPMEGFSVFGEYSQWYGDTLVVGAGYGFGDVLTVGGFYLVEWEEFGIYANVALGQFRINGEVFFDPGCYDGAVTALYVFDLDPLGLGVGAGFDICEMFGIGELFVEVAAEVDLDMFKIYGSYLYYPDYSDGYFMVGAGIAF